MGLSDFIRSLFGQGAPAPASASAGASTPPPPFDAKAHLAALWQQQIAQLVYPFDLIPGEQAEAAFLAAQERGRSEGFSPLIVAPSRLPVPHEPLPRERLIFAAHKVLSAVRPASEFFDAGLAEMIRDAEEDPEIEGPALFDALRPAELPSLAGGMHTPRLTHEYDPATRTFAPFPEVALVRVPTPHSWEIPAYFLYGDWNGNPLPEQMVSVAKHWHECYGADVCGIGEATLEFRVARRPAGHQEAVALLREQYMFCPQHEFDQTVFEDVAAELQVVDYWFFWWD